MNYLTNYYKNLCEQLQEKINMLEANIRSASEIDEIGREEYRKNIERRKAEKARVADEVGGFRDLFDDEVKAAADETIGPYTARALRRERLITKATEQLPDVVQSGDVETARQYADVMGDIADRNISGKVAGYRNLPPESAESILSGREQVSQISRGMRKSGVKTLVPADIAAMRKFIQMGRGQYQPPFPQPEGPVGGMHVNPTQY